MSGSNFWLSGAWTLREGCGKCFLSPRLFFSVSTSCLGYMMLHFSLKQRNTWCQSWCSAAVLVELQSISVCCCGSLVLSFHLWLREHTSQIGSKLQQRKSVLRKKKKSHWEGHQEEGESWKKCTEAHVSKHLRRCSQMLSPGASLPAFVRDPRGRGELGAAGVMWLQRVRAGEGFSEPAP